MGLNSFKVENEKALRLAACEVVPPVMVVAGPNGVGKSTLLWAIHRQVGGTELDPDTQVLYQPPHRAIRRQQVQRRWLTGGALRRLSDFFTGQSLDALEGLQIPFPSRSPDNVDEAGSTLKYTLGRLENRRQTVLAALVDQHSQEGKDVPTADLPDVFEPVRRLTTRLLPHLEFERVDFSNEDNIRCVFTRTDTIQTDELDLDDLSSGEKAIFLLFLPLIETDITARLDAIDPGSQRASEGPTTPDQSQDRVFLIDETEQHLHPELQARLLGYLREEASRTSVQFMVTTHSPTLVDQAFDDELHVLNFPSAPGENQLRRVASNAERLAALRALTGNTFVVTTGRTIICIEGERDPSTGPSDIRLLETLHPAATRYTFVPVGGKGNVIRVVKELRNELSEEGLGIRVAGLVDLDRTKPDVEGIVAWPVCMIENLLLDPKAVAEEASMRDSTAIDASKVQEMLAEEGQAQRDEEVALRVMAALGAKTVRLKGTSAEEIKGVLTAAAADLQVADDAIDKAVATAEAEVDDALADGSFVKTFRGKALLRGLYRRLGTENEQVSYEQFAYAVAQRVAKDETIKETIKEVFAALSESESSGSAREIEETPEHAQEAGVRKLSG